MVSFLPDTYEDIDVAETLAFHPKDVLRDGLMQRSSCFTMIVAWMEIGT